MVIYKLNHKHTNIYYATRKSAREALMAKVGDIILAGGIIKVHLDDFVMFHFGFTDEYSGIWEIYTIDVIN